MRPVATPALGESSFPALESLDLETYDFDEPSAMAIAEMTSLRTLRLNGRGGECLGDVLRVAPWPRLARVVGDVNGVDWRNYASVLALPQMCEIDLSAPAGWVVAQLVKRPDLTSIKRLVLYDANDAALAPLNARRSELRGLVLEVNSGTISEVVKQTLRASLKGLVTFAEPCL